MTNSLSREKASQGEVQEVGGVALSPSIAWRRISDIRAINFGGGGAEASVGTAKGMPEEEKNIKSLVYKSPKNELTRGEFGADWVVDESKRQNGGSNAHEHAGFAVTAAAAAQRICCSENTRYHNAAGGKLVIHEHLIWHLQRRTHQPLLSGIILRVK
jgi:hypothetical protein